MTTTDTRETRDRIARQAEHEGDLAGQLHARLRADEVSLERVGLAAWLGYAPALEVALEGRGAARSWAPTPAQIALYAAEGLLEHDEIATLAADFAGRVAQGEDGLAAIAAARAWVASPSSETADAALRAAVQARATWWASRRDFPPGRTDSAAEAAACAASAASAADTDTTARILGRAAHAADAAEMAAESREAESAWQAQRVAEVLCWGIGS